MDQHTSGQTHSLCSASLSFVFCFFRSSPNQFLVQHSPIYFKNKALFEKEFESQLIPKPVRGAHWKIKNISYSPDKILLEVETDRPSVLVISNTYSPFWKCKINNIDRKILPANGFMWGVPVEAGFHKIEFNYQPPYRLF